MRIKMTVAMRAEPKLRQVLKTIQTILQLKILK